MCYSILNLLNFVKNPDLKNKSGFLLVVVGLGVFFFFAIAGQETACIALF